MAKNLNDKIKQETERLNELREKREDIDTKIRKSEEALKKYRLLQNSVQYEEIQKATEELGISITEIIEALKSGKDMAGLQKRVELAKVNMETAEASV